MFGSGPGNDGVIHSPRCTWVRNFEVDLFPYVSARYWTSFYFVVKTIMAVGYGDMYPVSSIYHAYVNINIIMDNARHIFIEHTLRFTIYCR